MGNKIGSNARFSHLRERTKTDLLPDRCRVIPPARTVTASGSYTPGDGEPLLYDGLPDVPCRLDISKHYRSEQIIGQEAIVNDFELHFPFDFPIKADHKIILNDERYEVRKLLDANSYRVTKVALVSRVDVGKR